MHEKVMLALMPVRVTFPDGRPGIRHAEVKNPRLVGETVIGDAEIDKQIVLVAMDEKKGEYFPCDKNLKEIPYKVNSTSRIKHKQTRTNARSL